MRQPRTSLVGRADDLARLGAAAGVPRRPGPLGLRARDPALGKTRLLRHLLEAARAEGFAEAVGHCVAQSGAAMPYLPFVEALRGVDQAAPDAVAETLGAHPALAQVLPGWTPASGPTPGPMSGAAQSPASPPASPPAAPAAAPAASGPGAVAEAVHACLTRAGAQDPLLVVIEDVHWADLSSLDLLTLLLTRGFTTPVSLVVSYRSDDVHRGHPLHPVLAVWARLSDVARLDLGPLPEAAMRELVRALAEASAGASAGASPADVDAIAHRAAGNAFFAEELVACCPGELGDDLGRVLRTRLEQLDDVAQRVVRAVAIGGRQVGHELLWAVAALPEDELDRAVQSAIDHHTLELTPSGDYALRHALVGEAVLATLLPGQRRRLHRAYAAALAHQPGLAPASELARHAAASGDLTTAITAGRAAGESALAMGGAREALALFESVLGWMEESDPSRDEVTLAAARAAAVAGDVTRGVALLDDQLTHPGRSSGPGRARLLAAHVVLSRLEGVPGSRAFAEEAVELTEGRRDRARLEALASLVQVLVDRQELTDAARVGGDALALAEELGADDLLADLRTVLAALVADDSDPSALEARLRAVIESTPPAAPARTRAHHWLGLLHYRAGSLPAALADFDAGAAVAELTNRQWAPFESWCRLRGGLVAYELGDLDGALQRLDMPGPPYPQPGWAAFQALRLGVEAARSWEVDPGLFAQVQPWWSGDPIVASLSVGAAVELAGRRGSPREAVSLLGEGVAILDREWSPREPILVRLVATLVGVLADAVADADRAARAELRAAVDAWTPRAEEAFTSEESPGPEGRAWRARLDAERLRFAWLSGEPVGLEELAGAWRGVAEAFAAYGSRYEAARSTAVWGSVLAAAGDLAGVDAAATSVERAASEIGSGTLALLARRLRTPGAAAGAGATGARTARRRGAGQAAASLTPRERLFISTKTASVHVSHILAKLGATTRGEAVDVARRRGLLG